MTSSGAELPENAIAVIGMAGKFPGAESVSAFWRNLRAGVESIVDLSTDELLANGVTESALVSLGVDGAFLVAYPMLLYTSIRVLLDRAVAAPHPLHRLGTRLAWASLACIPLDALENVLLWRVVSRGAAGSDILLAGIAASLKFLLIAAALIWIVAALLQWRTARNAR